MDLQQDFDPIQWGYSGFRCHTSNTASKKGFGEEVPVFRIYSRHNTIKSGVIFNFKIKSKWTKNLVTAWTFNQTTKWNSTFETNQIKVMNVDDQIGTNTKMEKKSETDKVDQMSVINSNSTWHLMYTPSSQ